MTLETKEKETKTASPLTPDLASPLTPPPPRGGDDVVKPSQQGAVTQSGALAARETGDVGSMGTGGTGGDAKQRAGGKHDEDKQNVVRDRSGKAVLGMDGKPITYGGDGQLTNVQLYELLNQRQELTPEEKNAISHRGKALREFIKILKEHMNADNK